MDAIYASLPIFAQNAACTWAGYRRSRLRYTPHFYHTLEEWERTLTASLATLHEIQWQRLERLIEHARSNVPYYRDIPAAVKTTDTSESIRLTLSRIPPLEKSDYRGHTPDFVARNIPRGHFIPGKTSGTTGTALKLWWTPEAVGEEFAAFWRGAHSLGAQINDPRMTFNGQTITPIRQHEPPFWRTNYWNRQTLFSSYHCSPEHLPHYVDAVHSSRAAFAQGYPSFMYLVALAMLQADRPLPPGRLKGCFTSSESLLANQRAVIERAFGAPVQDRYAASELCISMTQCKNERYHVDMEFCIVEVEHQEETSEWVRGPILATGLGNCGTPFIRYRIGDIGTKLKRPCDCGRAGDVFLSVDGRVEDYVVTPDGAKVGRLDHIFKEQLDVAEAQILQESPRAIDVLLVACDSFDKKSEIRLLRKFRSRLGSKIQISIRYVDSIPREPNGKFRAVKSKIGRMDSD
jgi:phenylacetate-coenzyme A ligase PaaK-like adenylate-forming protein